MPDATGADPRVRRLAAWTDPVTRVRFVDGRRAEALGRLGVASVGDLLQHYPHRYLDLASAPSLADVEVGTEATVVGRIHEIKVKRPRRGLTVTEVALVDGTGVVVGVWFNQPYVASRLTEGDRMAFAGKVTMDYGLKHMRTPLVERIGDEGAEMLGRVLPVHPTTEGLSANWLRRLVMEALDEYGDVPDPLPAQIRLAHDLLPFSTALMWQHFPPDLQAAETARRTLAFHEFFVFQLALDVLRGPTRAAAGTAHQVGGPRATAVREALGFDLTGDQREALGEIGDDLSQASPMNRLLLGDVGTGKTAVAAIAMASVVDGGHQAAMMAPTEVLATQYASRIGQVFDQAGIAWALLTGSTPAAERRKTLAGLADGSISVALGTHALISDDVVFERLALAVVDEQHRFGVEQRLALRRKASGVDLLVMTATPIPRSLALTLYGDLETSYLRERPSGRDPSSAISTRVVHRDDRRSAYDAVRAAASEGRQSYVVCPLVEDSAVADAKSVTDEAERLSRDVFPDLRVAALTGRMSSQEKRRIMESFGAGDIDVLVSTTVVEVGVDVPNATVLIIEDAERYGLAQLHQLRGRVGRGDAKGEVMLFADPKTDEGVRRMAAIETIADGFELAEIDLRLRGEGDVLGSRQSGLPTLRAASLIADADLLEAAREDARSWTGAPDESAAAILAPVLSLASGLLDDGPAGSAGAG